ncbi:MAG: hypothetical protein U0289_05100 [Cyclobacteriaceae bacterium]
MELLTIQTFWTEALPNWIMAVAAAWGAFEVIRGYFKLKQQQKDSEQKVKFLDDQLNEFRKQTTQFEYQTTIMSENNKILEKGIENLVGILSKSQEAQEQQADLERQRRIIEIRPYFAFSTASSNPNEFEIKLRNQGGAATNFRIIDTSANTLLVNPLRRETITERGQETVISGRPAPGQNANLATGQILLGFTDADGNEYQQNIIKNYSGFQVGVPTRIQR